MFLQQNGVVLRLPRLPQSSREWRCTCAAKCVILLQKWRETGFFGVDVGVCWSYQHSTRIAQYGLSMVTICENIYSDLKGKAVPSLEGKREGVESAEWGAQQGRFVAPP